MYSRRKKRKQGSDRMDGTGDLSPADREAQFQGTNESLPMPPDLPAIYVRARWRHWFRILTVVILLGLNVAIIGSTIDSYVRGQPRPLPLELLSYGVVLMFDAIILVPGIAEADRLELRKEGLTIRTLFWKSNIAWSKITSLRKPEYLTYAILRTPRAFYFIRKPDFKEFEDLMEKAHQMLALTGSD
jgi:hypothetical protein